METSNERKDGALKTLAILGFVAVVVGGVWLAVQIVQFAPQGFMRLAELTGRLHGTPQGIDLDASTTKGVVNNDETFTISWSPTEQATGYSFTYSCTENVIVTIKNSAGTFVPVICDQPIDIEMETVGEIDVKISAGGDRFTEIPYSITAYKDERGSILAQDTERITVVNATIPQAGLIAGASDTETDTEAAEEPISTLEPVVTTPESPTPTVTPTNPQPTTPTVRYEYVLPTSNPQGYTDLAISYKGVGHLEDGIFAPRGTIDNDAEGALRFSVTNLGTKTSQAWTYEVLLPNGRTYVSGEQAPLKPNEIATITLGFPTSETGIQKIAGEVETDEDLSSSNDEFQWSVTITG